MNIYNFDLSFIYTRTDGSYVVNQGSYHVPNEGEWVGLWAQVDAYAKEHPEVVIPEPVEEVPEPTPEEQEAALKKYYTDFIQSMLDKEAQKLGYDNCNSVCTYIDTGISKFDSEGQSFRIWRSKVWNKAYEILDLVKNGSMEIPTEEELISMLPKLEIIYE